MATVAIADNPRHARITALATSVACIAISVRLAVILCQVISLILQSQARHRGRQKSLNAKWWVSSAAGQSGPTRSSISEVYYEPSLA